MVDIKKLTKGDNVHYKPSHFMVSNKSQNGLVKSIASNKQGVFVVYNCDGNWKHFENYTAALTRPEDLFLGWDT